MWTVSNFPSSYDLLAVLQFLFIMKLYMSTQKNTKKNKKQMNKELDYDTYNDSVIISMSAAPKIESSA